MINIIFEGSPGSGKTTIIKEIVKKLKKENIKVGFTIDIDKSTPLYNILNNMHKETPLVKGSNSFNTLLYETFIQGADYFYLREKIYSQNNEINIFDRSYFSVYSYQKVLLKEQYGNCESFFKCFMYNLEFKIKNIDLIIYIDNPLNISLKRAERRDNKKYSNYEIKMLNLFEKELKKTIKNYENKYKVLYLKNINLKETINDIYSYIMKIYNK